MYRTILKIEGMRCGMCEAHICAVIRKTIPSARKIKASYKKNEAVFLTDEDIDRDDLKKAIAETGYACTAISSERSERKGCFV